MKDDQKNIFWQMEMKTVWLTYYQTDASLLFLLFLFCFCHNCKPRGWLLENAKMQALHILHLWYVILSQIY